MIPPMTRVRVTKELACLLPGMKYTILDGKSISRLKIDNFASYEASGGTRDWRYRALLMLVRKEKKLGNL